MAKLTTTSNLNQRKGATTHDEVIQTIPKGATVEWNGYAFCGGSTPWYLVEYKGKLGLCSSQYLKG